MARIERAIIAALLVAGMGTGCAKHVVFTKQIQESGTAVGRASGDVARLYVDMYGDLYPDPDLAVGDELLQRKGSLRDAMWAAAPPACDMGQLPPAEQALCQAAHDRSTAAWDAAQDALWVRAGRRIAEAQGGASRPVLLLVHGFNVENAESNFAKTRSLVVPLFEGQKPLAVQVHWDGFSSVLRRAWARAQFSGPLVGLRLRTALNELSPSTPLRIFTHSSGAFVVGSAFGDATAALPLAQDAVDGRYPGEPYDRYVRNAGSRDPGNSLRIPQIPDLRIGMVVAATPTNTFVGSPAYPATGFHAEHAVLVFGVNPEDQTIAKGFNLQRLSYLGATTLGGDFQAACDVGRELERRTNGAVQVDVMDISDSAGESNPGYLGAGQSHSWAVYLERDKTRGFVGRWLGLPGAPPGYACPD